MRAAPIQVNFFGYPGTMGTVAIDYIFADEIVIPPNDRKFYTESVCYLPYSYQANDSKRTAPDAIPSRKEMGLPDGSLVFCCFNSCIKITPDAFKSWMRILANVPKSVLWLYVTDRGAQENLRAEAARHSVSPERLIFAGNVLIGAHLARQCLADLFLDTFHYGAHVTASDALWAGLPVLTRLGGSFPSRVGASLLTALGLTDLIARTTEEFE
jgi:predicted O-linked N-acetylglucosamine transferase (SPINDLY family)